MSSDKNLNNLKILGIDYGTTNIGLAFGLNGLSYPITSISGKNTDQAISDITRVVIENKIDLIVIGLPLNENNKETKMSLKVRRFAKLLKTHCKKPIRYVNEYLTSKEALENSISQGYSKKNRSRIDSLSATIIIKKFYEEST